jgi:uncharacterized protein YgiM (DUF1202 family)
VALLLLACNSFSAELHAVSSAERPASPATGIPQMALRPSQRLMARDAVRVGLAHPQVRVIHGYLNIRTGPGMNFPILGQLAAGRPYALLGITPGANGQLWGLAELNGQTGWFNLKYTNYINQIYGGDHDQTH